jgi:hypothetical protein
VVVKDLGQRDARVYASGEALMWRQVLSEGLPSRTPVEREDV